MPKIGVSYVNVIRYLKQSFINTLIPVSWFYSRSDSVVLLSQVYTNETAKTGKGGLISSYLSNDQEDPFIEDFSSRILLTYRTQFEPIACRVSGDASISSDAGWGCMIRVMQMLLAQCMQTICLGREWRRAQDPKDEKENAINGNLQKLLTLFFDNPTAALSVHQFVEDASVHQLIPPGNRLGPTSSAETAARLVKKGQVSIESTLGKAVSAVVFHEAVIHEQEIICLLRGSEDKSGSSVIILLPTRLGSHCFNVEEYQKIVQRCFGLKSFQGLAGGGPTTRAHFFVAASTTHLFFLDPHALVQSAANHTSVKTSQFFTRVPKALCWESLNPSMSFGFLVSSEEEFAELLDSLGKIDPSKKVFGSLRNRESVEIGPRRSLSFEVCQKDNLLLENNDFWIVDPEVGECEGQVEKDD